MKKVIYILVVLVLLLMPNLSYAEQKSDFEINYLYDKGVVDEVIFMLYNPKFTATREEAVVMIAKALGLDGTQRNTDFSDVPKSNIYSGFIQSAVDAGIVSGYKDGKFRPDRKLTRGHIAIFIERAFGDYLPTGNIEFKDVSKKHSSYNAVKKLITAGITSGYEDGAFKPENTLTMNHLSVFMYRTVKYLENQGVDIPLKSNLEVDDSKIFLTMTYNEIYKLVENKIDYTIEDKFIITKLSRNNKPGTTTYAFENGQLIKIMHEYELNYSKLPSTLTELHSQYLSDSVSEFGNNYFTDEDVTNDSLAYNSIWNYDDFGIMLRTKRTTSDELSVVLFITLHE